MAQADWRADEMGNALLRATLTVNAAFSLTCGCFLAAFGAEAAALILAHPNGGGGAWALRGLGVGLIALAILLGFLARDRDVGLAKVAPIVISDFVWVALSAAALALTQGVLTEAGRLIVGLIGAIVALLASLQWYGGRLTARAAN
jgi:hypothetical protein